MTEDTITALPAGKKKRIMPLSLKIGIVLACSILLGVLGWWLTNQLGYWLVGKFYMSNEACSVRMEKMVDSLQGYLEENEVYTKDGEALKKWCSTQAMAYLTLYIDNGTYISTDGSFLESPTVSNYSVDTIFGGIVETEDISQTEVITESTDTFNTGYAEHLFTFADGNFLVALTDLSELKYYSFVDAVSLLTMFVIILLGMLLYSGRITHKVVLLSREVSRITAGELNKSIHPIGRDELYLLAEDVESMRAFLVEKLQSEQMAWHANNELITAMAHDIRNPLTTLIGYSDLLADGKALDAAKQQQYIEACRQKAYQLKYLTDEMFGYFLVFGNTTIIPNNEVLNAPILLEQLLGEAVIHLRTQGFTVETDVLEDEVDICTDVMLLKRITDNLFANIEKYADCTAPIQVSAQKRENDIHISFSNRISEEGGLIESNKIGLKTCEKLAGILGYTFSYSSENGVFCTELNLPICLKK